MTNGMANLMMVFFWIQMVLFPILIAGVIYNVKISLSTDKYGYDYMLPGMGMIIGVGFNIIGIATTYPYAWGA